MLTLPATAASLGEAVLTLRAGEVVAYPTETVYGLGVDPFNADAVKKLFQVKGRPESKPVLLIVSDPARLSELALEITPQARACMDAFWPGALSLLLPKKESVPDALCAASPWVCVRCPGGGFARDLCAAFGGAITSTSANKSGEAPAITVNEINMPGVALRIDGGELGKLAPSTVFNPATGEVVREGAISKAAVMAVWGR